jgi:hypothetical protein
MFRARRGGQKAGRKDRRGAIAVMAAMLAAVFMMLGAVSVDYARMQYFRTQLRTAADAAAHSGAVIFTRTNGDISAGTDSAVVTGNKDLVSGTSPNIQLADIKWGDWDDATHSLDTIAPINEIDAIKVTARYNGNFLLSRFFGKAGGQLKVTSVAWSGGSVVNVQCLKPWAIPYSALLGAIPHDPADVGYNLTPQDVQKIRDSSMYAPIKIDLGSGNIEWTGGTYAGQDVNQYTPGNFGHLDLDPALNYRDEIGTCANNNIQVGESIQLQSQTGNAVGQTSQGVEDLCRSNGSYVKNGQDFTCNYAVTAAIWSFATGGPGNNTQYVVKYIGGFVITGFIQPGWLTGYFTGFQNVGNVTSMPGPVTRVILVY